LRGSAVACGVLQKHVVSLNAINANTIDSTLLFSSVAVSPFVCRDQPLLSHCRRWLPNQSMQRELRGQYQSTWRVKSLQLTNSRDSLHCLSVILFSQATDTRASEVCYEMRIVQF